MYIIKIAFTKASDKISSIFSFRCVQSNKRQHTLAKHISCHLYILIKAYAYRMLKRYHMTLLGKGKKKENAVDAIFQREMVSTHKHSHTHTHTHFK